MVGISDKAETAWEPIIKALAAVTFAAALQRHQRLAQVKS
jgi:hypothetical protein